MVRGNVVILSPRYYIVQNSLEWSPVFFSVSIWNRSLRGSPWGLPSAVTCAYGLKFNRQPSKKVMFYRQPSKRFKGYFKCHYFIWSSRAKNLQSWKTSSHVLKTTLSRSYTDKILLLAYRIFFRNFISERASNTQQLLLIYTELYIFFNSWIDFHFITVNRKKL